MPAYPNQEVQSHFESEYLDRGIDSQRRYPNESLIGELAAHYFHLDAPARAQTKVLELGCGSGANLWMVAREGFEAHGIDFSQTGLECCRQALEAWGTTATLQQADMLSLPYEDASIDFAYDVVSMQHLDFDQHATAYREVARILKPGGRFFSYHLGDQSISQQVAEEFVDHATVRNIPSGYPLANNGPMCFLSANEARALLQGAGLTPGPLESLTRTYRNRTMSVEYLLITAFKPR